MLKVLYFASLRERLGHSEETIPTDPAIDTVADLIRHLAARDAAGATAFGNTQLVRAAVNQEFATPATKLVDGDEVAFFPPVTGG